MKVWTQFLDQKDFKIGSFVFSDVSYFGYLIVEFNVPNGSVRFTRFSTPILNRTETKPTKADLNRTKIIPNQKTPN